MSVNAIRISDLIETVYVDFSSIEAIKRSAGFKRIYTVHTKSTLEMSSEVGFHVGGFCDDQGNGGKRLSEAISGYPQLPSDLILCAMDEHYAFLPLSPEQIKAIIGYITSKEWH
ncbi:MAG: hypothetical protein K6F32_06920 [Bacilli bacterium]|nr:hypothetical protein [Bacilli bacterium]